MISVVCVYNNKAILDNFLLKSLKNQTVAYELILMDNTNGKFKSAAEALNKGGKRAKNKYIMFVHQDIDLCSNEWLEETEFILDSLENLGIAGVAGKIKYQHDFVTNIEDGIPRRSISDVSIKSPVKVQILDECLLIIPKKIFDVQKFDEKTCNNWHLYGADFSLTVKKMGLYAYVIPNYLYHRSAGYSYSVEYEFTLKKLLKKHFLEGVIHTTREDHVTFYPLFFQEKWPYLQSIIISILKMLDI